MINQICIINQENEYLTFFSVNKFKENNPLQDEGKSIQMYFSDVICIEQHKYKLYIRAKQLKQI